MFARTIALALDLLLAGAFGATAAMYAGGFSFEQLMAAFEPQAGGGPPPFDADRTAAASRVFLLAFAAAPLGFAWSVARRGGSPGKALIALSVRDYGTGAAPGYGRALTREALRLAHVPLLASSVPGVYLLGMFAWIAVTLDMARNRASRTWYDRLTRTVVVVPAELVEPPEPE